MAGWTSLFWWSYAKHLQKIHLRDFFLLCISHIFIARLNRVVVTSRVALNQYTFFPPKLLAFWILITAHGIKEFQCRYSTYQNLVLCPQFACSNMLNLFHYLNIFVWLVSWFCKYFLMWLTVDSWLTLVTVFTEAQWDCRGHKVIKGFKFCTSYEHLTMFACCYMK